MLTASPTMSAICIVFSPLVAPVDGARKPNGTNCAIAVTGIASGVSGTIAFELSRE
jgi:hypothetical protein